MVSRPSYDRLFVSKFFLTRCLGGGFRLEHDNNGVQVCLELISNFSYCSKILSKETISSSHYAKSKETPSSFGLNWMIGFGELEGQTMLPAKGGNFWRVKESEDLSFGTRFSTKKEGCDCEFGRV
ncbi:hypothetical protein MTR_7g013920 [Medicago truncatula]|uniref:Uncharacterized protein n=1 Tax=Medicago truncatula TaxID=3880 RepID=A0A072TVY1_MEDTR|nr:hypothetical protein MTR_7g013920 [Medicago truncatula]